MLYDKRWDRHFQIDEPLTDFIAWLEMAPPRRRYCYSNTGHCLIAQFLIARGHKNVRVGSFGGWEAEGASGQMYDIAQYVAAEYPMTFGAALKRARKLAAEQ